MFEIVILASGVLVSTAIGLFVFARNPRHIVNQLYGLITLLLIFYPLVNYLSLNTANRLFYIRVVIAITNAAVAALYYLIYLLADEKKRLSNLQRLSVIFTTLVIGLDLTPLVFSRLSSGLNPSPVPNIGAVLFVGQLLAFLAGCFILLIKRVRETKDLKRLQYVYMLVGITPIFFAAPVTGFVMPVLYHNVSLVALGPVYATFFVALIGYSIVKHRLFDIRLVIARTLGYLFSLVVLASIYGIVTFGIAQFVFGLHFAVITQAILSGVTALAAFSFAHVKTSFDKFTNRLFYRDAYDPQALFDELNRKLVSTLDLDKLLYQTSVLLATNLKAEYCTIGLKEVAGRPLRMSGSEPRDVDFKDIMRLRQLTVNYHHSIIVTDELEDARHQELKGILTRYDVAVLVRLAPNVRRKEEGLGYLVLGSKKSGNPYASHDLRVLDTVANELIIAVQNALHFEEIQNFNVTLQQKVIEATNKLRRTNEKLKALDETKDDFISMASHQLRTPLTSVKGYLSMVLEGDAGKITKTQREMLGQAFFSSQRMVYLIADLLNVSRLRTGKFVIELARVNLADLVMQEMSQLTETAAAKSLKLVYHKPEHFPELMLDETKTRQVVMNFMDNAIYYTPAGGEITIDLQDKPGSVELRVIDNGIGVPKSEQHHLFTKFYRAGNARKARPDGTGLGLFMAKKVITAQGGATIFNSEEGKGSTFGFTFSKADHSVNTSAPTPVAAKAP